MSKIKKVLGGLIWFIFLSVVFMVVAKEPITWYQSVMITAIFIIVVVVLIKAFAWLIDG